MMQSPPPTSAELKIHGAQKAHLASSAGFTPLLYASAVFLVLSLSFLIRVGGIPHHEPMVLHVDEAAFVKPALRMVRAGDFNPHWFGHPGSLTMYCLAAVYALLSFFGGIDGKDLAARYAEDPTEFHVLGKYLMALFSMCIQWGLLLLARQFLPRWSALLAVVLLACSRLDIELASLIRTDAQQSALLVFLTFVLLQAMDGRKHRSFVISGVLLGFATAVKWPSVVACLPIAITAVLANTKSGRRPDWRRAGVQVGLAAAASVVGLFVAAPYVFLDWATVIHNVAAESRSYHLGATSGGFFPALAFYGRHLRGLAGTVGLLLAVLGAATSLRGERWRWHVVPLSMFCTYLLFLCTLNLNWPRWAVPLLPYPCLYLAIGVRNVAQLAQTRVRWSGTYGAITATCSALLLLLGGANVKTVLSQRTRDDAYDASQWVARNLPIGSKVLVEHGGPYLPKGQVDIYQATSRGRLTHIKPVAKYHAPRGKLMYLTDMKAAVRSMDYVILGTVYQRIRLEKARYGRSLADYEWVKNNTHLAKRFGVIEVRRVKKSNH